MFELIGGPGVIWKSAVFKSVFDSISSLSEQNVCACVVSIPHDNKSNEKIRCRTTAHQTTCQFTVMFTIAFTFKSIISQKIHCVMHSKCLDYVRKVICYKSMHLLMLWHSILMNTRLLTDYKTKIFLAWRHLDPSTPGKTESTRGGSIHDVTTRSDNDPQCSI